MFVLGCVTCLILGSHLYVRVLFLWLWLLLQVSTASATSGAEESGCGVSFVRGVRESYWVDVYSGSVLLPSVQQQQQQQQQR